MPEVVKSQTTNDNNVKKDVVNKAQAETKAVNHAKTATQSKPDVNAHASKSPSKDEIKNVASKIEASNKTTNTMNNTTQNKNTTSSEKSDKTNKQADNVQEVKAEPLATPVQAKSPAVIKVVDENGEEHLDLPKTFFVRIKEWWHDLPKGIKRYLAIVLLPTILCFGYFGLWATPMYVSEVKFAVKSAEGGANSLNLMSSLFRVPTASLQDAMVVEEFLKSNDAFYAADRALNLIEHYSDPKNDLISRLAIQPTIDEIASFWNNITRISVNQDSNVITFEVRAYSPEMAQNINAEILHISDDLVNSLNERAKEDMLQLADLEVAEARNRLNIAQDALRDFRNKNQDLDLKATAAGMQSLVIELEGQAALLRTQIAEQSRYTDQDAPALKALRDRLVGVEEQIERERARLTEVSAQGTSLNTLASQYENLVTEAEFARQRLVFAMTSLEGAKADILAKNLYIVTVAKPSMPDESLFPKPFLFSFYVFLALSMAYAIISLVISAIKEHMGY